MFLINEYKKLRIFHNDIYKILKMFTLDDQIPHIIIHGPAGSGKNNLLMYILECLYGDEIYNLSEGIYKVTGSSNKTDKVPIMQSNFHIVISPNENNYDKYIIQDVINEYTSRYNLNKYFGSKKPFKTIVIDNIDLFSINAQASLRRIMELHAKNCRFIMKCRSLSSVIKPIQSRCSLIAVPQPTYKEILGTLIYIDYKENKKTDIKTLKNIAIESGKNIKTAIWTLDRYYRGDASKHTISISYDYIIDELINPTEKDVALYLDGYQDMIYPLIVSTIPCVEIIQNITNRLLERTELNNKQKKDIIKLVVKHEVEMTNGRRPIEHIDPIINGIIMIIRNIN